MSQVRISKIVKTQLFIVKEIDEAEFRQVEEEKEIEIIESNELGIKRSSTLDECNSEE